MTLVHALRHTIRAVRLLVRDRRVPRPLRWLIGLGLLPIPGPVDEAVLLLAALVLALFYRGPLLDAWQSSTEARAEPARGSRP